MPFSDFGRRSAVPLGALFLALSLAACSSSSKSPVQPDTRAADADAIRAADAEWNNAMRAKDVEKSVSFYADDAVLLANKVPSLQGHDNIRKEFQKMLSETGVSIVFTNTGVEVSRSGDLAWDHGTYQFTEIDKKGHSMKGTGKYLTVWKKQSDGSWKAVADMDNTDQ
jgi:uncharacterized protein (TIGR02246 family)